MPLVPGTVFASQVTDGRWTAYQVVSDDGKSPAIVALDYLDDAPPTLDQLRGVALLKVDHHGWNGRVDYHHVTPPKPPARWRELGVLPPPVLGPCNSYGGWPDGFAQIVLQRRWETEIPAEARAAYKAATRAPAEVDLGEGVHAKILRRGSMVRVGTREAPVARDVEVRWSALDELPHVSDLAVQGHAAGLVEYLRTRPLISDLHWVAHGRTKIDFSTTRLLQIAIDAVAPLRLTLPETFTMLALTSQGIKVTVVDPWAGARLRLGLMGAPLGLPRGLGRLRELAITMPDVLDLATIAKAFPSLESITVRGATKLLHVERLAALPRLRALTLYGCYQLDAAKLPPASTWPELDRVEIDGHRKVDAKLLKERLGSAPRFELRGGKTDAWLAANLDNPFRDWIDRDAATGKKAAAAWRKARAAKRITQTVLRAFIAVFNKLDAKPGLDTIDREEIGEAFFTLATAGGFDAKKAETWFDAWRDF